MIIIKFYTLNVVSHTGSSLCDKTVDKLLEDEVIVLRIGVGKGDSCHTLSEIKMADLAGIGSNKMMSTFFESKSNIFYQYDQRRYYWMRLRRRSLKGLVVERTIKRDLADLQEKGLLKRTGGRKDGVWIVVDMLTDDDGNLL